jgi:hypothetical protein
LKQLAQDIEQAGGIQNFDDHVSQALSILLDAGDPEIYGRRGSNTRRRLTQKVNKWKSLSPEQYSSVLQKLYVLPYKLRAKSECIEITEEFVAKAKKEKKKNTKSKTRKKSADAEPFALIDANTEKKQTAKQAAARKVSPTPSRLPTRPKKPVAKPVVPHVVQPSEQSVEQQQLSTIDFRMSGACMHDPLAMPLALYLSLTRCPCCLLGQVPKKSSLTLAGES